MSLGFDLSNTVDITDALVERSLYLDESYDNISFSAEPNSNVIERPLSLDESSSSIDIELENDININVGNLKKYNSVENINNLSIPRKITDDEFVISDTTLLCLKLLVAPIALFSHVARFALSSISTAFSFAVAFFISDIMFFSVLDKFSLSHARYVLLAITGIVALSSIKEIIVSLVNLSLSFFKGTSSWYFSLVNSDCSFVDFLLGKNTITEN